LSRLTFTSPSENTSSRWTLPGPPLMGLVTPLHQHNVRVHSRAAGAALRPLRPTEVTFRPRGSSPPRRLAPHTASRVCLAPRPVMGFAPFPAPAPNRSPRLTRGAFPGAPHPPECSPRLQPHRVTATVTLLSSPSRVDFRVLLRRRVRCARPTLIERAPATPLGFLPLQGITGDRSDADPQRRR
jgi:hypothetical protein